MAVDRGIWMGEQPLVLASASTTRLKLLRDAGIDAETRVAEIDERAIEAEAGAINASALALRLAREKARTVAGLLPSRVVVAADQVLAFEDRILHKPANEQDACEQIALLQGKTHHLISAVTIIEADDEDAFCETARMTLRTMTIGAIGSYVRLAGRSRVTSSVGGYQVEGLGIHLFDAIEGDHSCILGLPLIPLLARLRARRLLAF